jgi:PAS domain S-box-containing protein
MFVRMKLKFSHQILLFVSLPIILQIVFVGLLYSNIKQLDYCYEREAEAANYLTESVKFVSQILTCASAQAMFHVTKDKKYQADFNRILLNVTKQSDILTKQMRIALGETREGAELSNLFLSLQGMSEQGQRAADSQDQIEMAVAYAKVSRVLVKTNRLSLGLLDSMTLKRTALAKHQIIVKNRIFEIIFGAVALNCLVVAVFLLTFFRVTSMRFQQLGQNVESLGANQKLQYKLVGDDDLAELDNTLHKVADVQRESRLKEQAIILNAVDLICALDQNNRISQINPAAELLWKTGTEQLLGRSFLTLVAPEDRERIAAVLQGAANASEGCSFEVKVIAADGELVEMQWNVIWSKEMKQLFCVAHDITERKKLERLRRELVAMVSHDLRSPMTSMQLTLNILSSGTFGDLSPEAKKRIDRAEFSLSQLVGMLNDFLEIEKLESGVYEMSMQSASASTIVKNGCTLLEELAGEQNIKISAEAMEFDLVCDSARLTRVITNLVSNAIKFSPKNSTIRVSARHDETYAVFEVEDQGRGIPKDRQELMFERFRQLQLDDERIKKGSGLGLAVCKSIVEAHKGMISVRSEVEKGSTFIVKLPLG